MGKKWFTSGSNTFFMESSGILWNFSKLYEKKKRQKHDQKQIDKTYCRAISAEFPIILKQTQGPKSKLSFRSFFFH